MANKANSFMGAQRALYTKRFGLDRETPTDYGIDNATWITGRNAAGTADVNMIRVNASDEVELATGESSTVSTKVVEISNEEIKALRATPKVLVAAPGAGKVIEFVSAVLFHDYGTNALTESTDNMAIRYTGTTGTIVSQAIEAGGFVDATADTMTNALPKIDTISAKSACENQALVLHNTGDGEYGGNAAEDTVWRAVVTYRVHTTGW